MKNKNLINLLSYFSQSFFPMLFMLIACLSYTNYLQIEKEKNIVQLRQVSVSNILTEEIDSLLNSVASDLVILTESQTTRNYFMNPNPLNQDELTALFVRFTNNRAFYKDISYINNDGQEKIRVHYGNGQSSAIAPQDLTNQNKQDFFQKALVMDPGEMYLSRIDPGKIENFDYSGLVFSKAVRHPDGSVAGLLVMDLFPDAIGSLMDSYSLHNADFRFALITPDGEWLKCSAPDSHELPFGVEYPGLWKSMHEVSGYAEDKEWFSYYRQYSYVPPYSLRGENQDPLGSLIISYSQQNFNFFRSFYAHGFVIIAFIGMLIIAAASFLLAFLTNNKRKSEHKLAILGKVFDNSQEAILLTDAHTVLTYVNKAFEQITGFSEKEVLGKKTNFFKSGLHNKEFYQEMWASINNTGRWQGEIWDKKKNGLFYPKWLTILEIKGQDEIQYVGIFEDLSKLKIRDDSINLLQNYDSLTLMPNLEFAKKVINEYIALNKEIVAYFLTIGISNYGILKDTLGYAKLDKAIIAVGNHLKLFLGSNDFGAKIFSDQFLLLIKDLNDEKQVVSFIHTLLDSFQTTPFTVDDEQIMIKINVGAVAYNSSTNHSHAQEIIENSGLALSFAQQQGEFRYCFYEPSLKERYKETLKLETYFYGALERGELSLVFQPQVKTGDSQIIGSEALLRWDSPVLGKISPDRFIPIAEKTELIVPIGAWIIEKVCRLTSYWRQNIDENIYTAVNISPVQFIKMDMYQLINDNLNKYNLEGKALEIEVTESTLLTDSHQIREQIDQIKSLGVKVAADDFGTGYSSLSYLQKFSFDKLKIDQQFVMGYPEKVDGTLAKVIISLAHVLEMTVVAEGVETEAQFTFMRENACDVIQGYYYSPPVSAEEYEKLLIKRQY